MKLLDDIKMAAGIFKEIRGARKTGAEIKLKPTAEQVFSADHRCNCCRQNKKCHCKCDQHKQGNKYTRVS